MVSVVESLEDDPIRALERTVGLIEAKRIKAAPDWSKALRPEFWQKAGGKVG